MTIETKYNIGDKIEYRNPVKYMSDIRIGEIVEISAVINSRGHWQIYNVINPTTIDGKPTASLMDRVEYEDIFGIKK